MAQNEFLSPKYAIHPFNTSSGMDPSGLGGETVTDFATMHRTTYFAADTCAAHSGLCERTTLGLMALDQLNVSARRGWKWAGIGFLAAFFLIANVAGAFALGTFRSVRNLGTSREADEAEEADECSQADVAVPVGDSVASVLPFQRMTVAWRDLRYTVQLNKSLGGGSKTLLHGIAGVAQPGRLLALMGASGAGKSTLLDVIAGRKTAGVTEGSNFLNGHASDRVTFARLTAYCEQSDVHHSFATVREALAFSATLRLPHGGAGGVSTATERAFVEEVLGLLELQPIAGRLIGEVGGPNSLSPGQRKMLTIAVELVSNAPVIFLDVRPIQCLAGGLTSRLRAGAYERARLARRFERHVSRAPHRRHRPHCRGDGASACPGCFSTLR